MCSVWKKLGFRWLLLLGKKCPTFGLNIMRNPNGRSVFCPKLDCEAFCIIVSLEP